MVAGRSNDRVPSVAVITGAASGIGSGLVSRCAERGMRVVLADIDSVAIAARAAELVSAGHQAIALATDVSDPDAVERLAAFAYDTWGQVDLLVNNAGIEAHGFVWEIPPALWQRVIGVNLNGVYYGLRSFIPRMLGSGQSAHIVNIASVAALGIATLTSPYRVSKHACLALTEITARELASIQSKIVISAVIPGSTRTAIFQSAVSADEDGAGSRAREEMRADLALNGIDPLDAAEIILNGAAKGLLRIHTHPEFSRKLIEQRSRELADLGVGMNTSE